MLVDVTKTLEELSVIDLSYYTYYCWKLYIVKVKTLLED